MDFDDFKVPKKSFPWWRSLRAIASLDVFIHLLLIFHAFYAIHIIKKCRCMHPHFNFLVLYYFGTLICGSVFVTVNAIPLCSGIYSLSEPWRNDWFNGFSLGFITSPFNMPIIIFSERLIAALKTKIYERFHSKSMLTSMSGLHIALTVAISVNSSLNDIEQVVFIHLFINLIIVSLMIAYFTVYAVTKYFLAKSKTTLNLSGKYQFLENLQANRSMMVFAFLTFLSSIASIAYIGTLICILIYKPEYNIKHVGVLLYAILSCVRGSILFFVPFVFIWSKKQLRFAYGGLYYKLTKETDRNARISTISMSDEEFHFMTLRSQWNDKYNGTKRMET